MKTLVLIPTYNERENIPKILSQLDDAGIDADILFVDDGSPDGTAEEIDNQRRGNGRIHLIQRGSKLGIGSAHMDGIHWAYENRYDFLVTMDCDLTHAPSDIPELLAALNTADVAVGTRYGNPQSLKGWNWKRKALTHTAHLLTRFFLGVTYDCTGAFRAYRLGTIPVGVFELVESKGYSFFFECLFVLNWNRCRVTEIPICLPPRTYGSSKMPAVEPFRGIKVLVALFLDRLLSPEKFGYSNVYVKPNPTITGRDEWDAYWEKSAKSKHPIYQAIATLYRRWIITRHLTREIRSMFKKGASVLHIGCGSGHVDQDNQMQVHITAVDTSLKALQIYRRCVPFAKDVCHASAFDLPFAEASFDGAYHLGVIEHFNGTEMVKFLEELHRVIKPGGKLLIFWPHEKATSVAVIKIWHHLAGANAAPLHPPEISLAKNRKWVVSILSQAGFQMDYYQFDFRDFWVQAVIRATRNID